MYKLLLLVFVYVVSADKLRSLTGIGDVGIKSDVENFIETVYHQPAACTADGDCHHLGKCETSEDGLKSCVCKAGTSGDFCETVDECVDNPVRCGTRNDVSCVFDFMREKADCKCDDTTKTYIVDEERCMSPCTKPDQCGQYGSCYHEIGDQMFCACDLGTSGDYCDIIDECHNKHVDCGVEPNVTCMLNSRGGAYCKCADPLQGFDYVEKICKDCAGCGKNAVRGCAYRDGLRRCNCKTRYYSNEKGVCVDCKCGPDSYGCKSENGSKICQCWGGYEPNGDVCEKCDCGSGSKCEFRSGKKVCTCKDGFIQSGPNSICTQLCNETNPCENGGKCVKNICICLQGTGGDLCKTIDDCRGSTKCGDANCLYNVTSHEAYCKCRYALMEFDDQSRTCRVCDCGTYQRSCSYVQGKKTCKCMDAYEERQGFCTLCFCKGYSSMFGCRFDGYTMVCRCLKGYAQSGDECKKCDCGDHGKCSLSGWGYKSCSCDEGYVEKDGMCKECNCGKNGRCFFYNGKKLCNCRDGFEEYEGTCKACDCGRNANCHLNSYGGKECTCHSGYGMKSGECTACYCDPGTSCVFKESLYLDFKIYSGTKECICPKNYANDRGSCSECDCGMEDSNCTMEYGIMICECPHGYEDVNKGFDYTKSYCKDINECARSDACPYTTECVNTPGSYDCVCKSGYEEKYKWGAYDIKKDGCQDINECVTKIRPCLHPLAFCVNTQGSYDCECQHGYSLHRGYVQKSNSCVQESRPWRTATIVVGVLSAVIIVGLLIGICIKHM